MLGKKLGMDLGSSTLRVVVKGEGVVVTQPMAMALVPGALLVGGEAVAAGAQPGVNVRWPVRAGLIVDEAALELLLQQAVTRAAGRQRIFKPDLVIAVMSTMPGAQRRALLDMATRAGARTVYLLDAPIAAAMGCNVALVGTRGHLVVDAGAGKTEVSAIAEEGTIAARCLPGVGENAPEADSFPFRLAGAVTEVLAEVPRVIAEDIRREGVLLCGGGARRDGLDRHLAATCGIVVRVAEEPLLCAVRGAGAAADNLDMLKRNVMYLR